MFVCNSFQPFMFLLHLNMRRGFGRLPVWRSCPVTVWLSFDGVPLNYCRYSCCRVWRSTDWSGDAAAAEVAPLYSVNTVCSGSRCSSRGPWREVKSDYFYRFRNAFGSKSLMIHSAEGKVASVRAVMVRSWRVCGCRCTERGQEGSEGKLWHMYQYCMRSVQY